MPRLSCPARIIYWLQLLPLLSAQVLWCRFIARGRDQMALTECDPARTGLGPARLSVDENSAVLGRLAELHGEAGRNLALARFLARSPGACVILMLAGISALIWAGSAGGGSLRADFGWAALVLFGVAAMTRNYIRGFARSLRRTPLQESASDLTMLLLYTGSAWGMGAFLVMPDLPAPALAFLFAAAPSAGVALALKYPKGTLAFTAPASLIPAAAAVMGAWPLDFVVATAILAAGASIAGLSFLSAPSRIFAARRALS
jgi:hypothetical protein